MAGRSMYFFMRLDELTQFIWEQAQKRGLHVLIHSGQNPVHLVTSLDTLRATGNEQFWMVSYAPVLPDAVPSYDFEARGQWEWVGFDMPDERGKLLTQTVFHTQLIWRGMDSISDQDQPRLKLYSAIRYALRKQLSYPTWAYNTNMPSLAPQPDRYFGYSPGAAAWCRSGGQMRQTPRSLVGFSVENHIYESLPTQQ